MICTEDERIIQPDTHEVSNDVGVIPRAESYAVEAKFIRGLPPKVRWVVLNARHRYECICKQQYRYRGAHFISYDRLQGSKVEKGYRIKKSVPSTSTNRLRIGCLYYTTVRVRDVDTRASLESWERVIVRTFFSNRRRKLPSKVGACAVQIAGGLFIRGFCRMRRKTDVQEDRLVQSPDIVISYKKIFSFGSWR